MKMTNREKFKEIFGFEPTGGLPIDEEICIDCSKCECGYNMSMKHCYDYWDFEYKGAEDGNNNN